MTLINFDMKSFFAILLLLCGGIRSQRAPFAGSRPIGFPELYDKTTDNSGLGNRFGEGDGTTQRLPLEALGDRDLVNRLSKLPIDKQPFWFINWQALEENRKRPQTYPQKPNTFVDSNVGHSSVAANVNVVQSSDTVDGTQNRFGTADNPSTDGTSKSPDAVVGLTTVSTTTLKQEADVVDDKKGTVEKQASDKAQSQKYTPVKDGDNYSGDSDEFTY